MPSTLASVARVIRYLEELGLTATLLVVPGCGWPDLQIERLLRWQGRGHPVAAHGWSHRIERWGDLRHRVHGLLFSRRVAEHLELDATGIEALLQRSFRWFVDHQLGAPELYVPPAWALGRIERARLRSSPFRWFELFRGLYDSRDDRFVRLPLVGFEADRPLRVPLISAFNHVNRALLQGRLRIAIHPDDLDLRMAEQLKARLLEAARR